MQNDAVRCEREPVVTMERESRIERFLGQCARLQGLLEELPESAERYGEIAEEVACNLGDAAKATGTVTEGQKSLIRRLIETAERIIDREVL